MALIILARKKMAEGKEPIFPRRGPHTTARIFFLHKKSFRGRSELHSPQTGPTHDIDHFAKKNTFFLSGGSELLSPLTWPTHNAENFVGKILHPANGRRFHFPKTGYSHYYQNFFFRKTCFFAAGVGAIL